MTLLVSFGHFISVLWSSSVHVFKAAPVTWLILAYVFVTMTIMVTGKKIKSRTMFVLSGLSFAIGSWSFSEMKTNGGGFDVGYGAGAWLGFSIIWLIYGIRDHNKAKKAAGGKK